MTLSSCSSSHAADQHTRGDDDSFYPQRGPVRRPYSGWREKSKGHLRWPRHGRAYPLSFWLCTDFVFFSPLSSPFSFIFVSVPARIYLLTSPGSKRVPRGPDITSSDVVASRVLEGRAAHSRCSRSAFQVAAPVPRFCSGASTPPLDRLFPVLQKIR